MTASVPPPPGTTESAASRPSQATLHLPAEDGPPPGPDLEALIEALLLVAPAATTIDELARGAGVPAEAVEAALRSMESMTDRGWFVQRHRGTVQLASAPRFAPYVRRFLGLERQVRLSPAALETLAIVAYRQPVTKAEIESVRGVDCSGVLATLHHRSLIESLGRLQAAGQPIQYGTTGEFLRHFGLQSLDDLPPLGEVDGRDAATVLEVALAEADLESGTGASAQIHRDAGAVE